MQCYGYGKYTQEEEIMNRLHKARPKKPWVVVDAGYKFIVEAPGDGYVTRDVCRMDGSTMASFYQKENAAVIEEAGAVWCETGMTPRQLQARIAELTAPPTPDSSGVVSDEDLARAFAGTNFGTDKHRELLHRGVLKKAGQYHCGHTITTIMSELGLIRTTGALTKKGVAMLRIAYHQQMIGGV